MTSAPKLWIKGAYRSAFWVPDESGAFRGEEYYNDLQARDRAALVSLVDRHCGIPQGYTNQEKYRHEGEQLYAFKRYQDRLLCFVVENAVLITNGFRKKSDKVPPAKIAIAKRIREHHLSRSNETNEPAH